jgi:hypothetical protein
MPAAIRRAASRVNSLAQGSAGDTFTVIDECQQSLTKALNQKLASNGITLG